MRDVHSQARLLGTFVDRDNGGAADASDGKFRPLHQYVGSFRS